MERPDGVIIGSAFILLVLVVSTVSRSVRATELRVSEADFVDQASAELGPSLVGKQVHMVPMKARSPEARAGKAAEIRRYYRIDEPLAFVHVNLLDNRSEFLAPLGIEVRREGRDYVIEMHGAIAIANTIAYLSEMVDPISIFLGLTREDLTRQAFRFLLLRGGGDGPAGLRDPPALLGVDGRGRRATADPPPVGLKSPSSRAASRLSRCGRTRG